MSERSSSKTALGVAALRAAHMLIDGEPKILDDPIVTRILDVQMIDAIRANPERLHGRGALALRSHVVLRNRYAEDRLFEAMRRGVRQYAILGAGLDTFAYRQPEWARELRIFEVDHPGSQREKRERLAAAGISAAANLEYVPIDFETTSLRDGLMASSLDSASPVFFSCLGVLVYLTEEAVEAVFRLGASMVSGSEIVFTFSTPDSERAGGEREARAAIASAAATLGEPFRTHFVVEELVARLMGRGFSKVSFLEPGEAAERYFAGRTDHLPVPRRASMASAVRG
jgi:methyltransferase (TIGR00027 family)